MNLSARDKKIAIVLAPLALFAAYWFLLLAPKREEASAAQAKLETAEQARDTARSQLRLARGSKTSFASDYSTMLRLGKAIPESVDMPSLLVQLDAASRGTDIKFMKVAVAETQQGGAAVPPAATGQPPAAAGGEPAQSTPGQQAEGAAEATETANAAGASSEQSGVAPADSQTSTTSGGSLPVGSGGAGAAPGSGAIAGTPALDTVALELEFKGSFFDLANFFHQLKRFVKVDNQDVVANGRLVTIESVSFTSVESFPKLTATLQATAYLAPEAQGTTAGATPAGPATVPAATPEAPAAPPAPTASVTP